MDCLQIVSDPFYIAAGPPDHLAVAVQPGHSAGGEPFRLQPQLEVHDAVGNKVIVPSVQYVTASLYSSPYGGVYSTNGTAMTPTLRGPSLTARFVNGTAEFQGLYINE